jgi:hypothetical protein
VSSRPVALALANLLMLALGCGLLPPLRLARSRRELLLRLPLAYAVGLAASGVLAAELAAGGVAVGPLVLGILAAGALLLGLPGLPAGEPVRARRPSRSELAALAALAVAAAFGVLAARLAAVRPLLEPSGEIWGLRARALYLLGHPLAPVFTDRLYPALREPLLLPGLEAAVFRFRGGFDGTLLELQLLGFALAFVGGAWVLLRRFGSPLLLSASLLAVIAAPTFVSQLLTSSADVPLACFVALGLASLGAWVRSGEPGLLPAATLFLAAGTLTENEGELLALAALLAAGLAVSPSAWRRLGLAAGALVAVGLPWHAWLIANRLSLAEDPIARLLRPSYLGAHAGQVEPAARTLWHELTSLPGASLLGALVVVGLAGALLQRRGRLALFGAGWMALSTAGLLVSSWLTRAPPAGGLATATVDSLLLGGALLVPLLLYTEPLPEPLAAPARRRHPLRRALEPRIRAAGGLALRAAGSLRLPHRTAAALGGAAPTSSGLPWGRPRREALLLALVAAATLASVYPVDSQDVSRLCLSQALVHLHVSNDSCLGSPYARDRAIYHGHLYSDKAPGMSVIELPAAVAVGLPSAVSWPYVDLRLWAVRVLSGGIVFILCAFLVGRISEGIAPGYGGASLVAFGLGTLVAPLAAANFEHITAGTLGLAAFALAWRRRPLLAGLAAGAAVDVAYEAGILVVILAAYVALRGRRSLLAYLYGLVPAALLLGAYDWAAFGAPWRISYRYTTKEFAASQAGGFFGVHLPYRHAIDVVFVGDSGILRLTPVVVAAALGLVLLGRRFRAEALVCAAVTLAFVVLDCGYYDPLGGLSPGPRFLVPALPFLALGLGPAFARGFHLTAALALVSIVPMTALTLTWANGGLYHHSIWYEVERFPFDRGASWIAQSLVSNALDSIGVGVSLAAGLVALAAASAFVLSLPLSFARRNLDHAG